MLHLAGLREDQQAVGMVIVVDEEEAEAVSYPEVGAVTTAVEGEEVV